MEAVGSKDWRKGDGVRERREPRTLGQGQARERAQSLEESTKEGSKVKTNIAES